MYAHSRPVDCCRSGTRTPIDGTRNRSPTIRRTGNIKLCLSPVSLMGGRRPTSTSEELRESLLSLVFRTQSKQEIFDFLPLDEPAISSLFTFSWCKTSRHNARFFGFKQLVFRRAWICFGSVLYNSAICNVGTRSFIHVSFGLCFFLRSLGYCSFSCL